METPFPRKLRLLRKLKRCTQNSLAKALNVSRTTVSAWENRIAEPDLATLKNIRDYLKVSYEDLLDDWLRRTDKPFSVSGGCLKNPDKRRKPVPFKNRKNGIFLSWRKSDRKTATRFRLTRGIDMTVPTIPRERISSKNFTVCSRLRKAININFSISTSIFMYPI